MPAKASPQAAAAAAAGHSANSANHIRVCVRTHALHDSYMHMCTHARTVGLQHTDDLLRKATHGLLWRAFHEQNNGVVCHGLHVFVYTHRTAAERFER